MHLTQLKLVKSPATAATLARFLASKYSEHQVLWELTGAAENAKREFLFRSDVTDDGLTLLVLSKTQLLNIPEPWVSSSKAYTPAFTVGQLLQFKLRVSPTIDKTQPDGARSKREDLVMLKYIELAGETPLAIVADSAAEQWLSSRSDASGFRLIESSASNYQRLSLLEKGTPFKIPSLDIDGVIEITDPAAFLARQAAGFGKTRFAGLGLMLVKPLC